MVPFEIATCQSQAQRSGGQAEATNLNSFIKLGNTMGRMTLYFKLSSVSTSCQLCFPGGGGMGVGRRNKPCTWRLKDSLCTMSLFPTPVISESLSFHICNIVENAQTHKIIVRKNMENI